MLRLQARVGLLLPPGREPREAGLSAWEPAEEHTLSTTLGVEVLM